MVEKNWKPHAMHLDKLHILSYVQSNRFNVFMSDYPERSPRLLHTIEHLSSLLTYTNIQYYILNLLLLIYIIVYIHVCMYVCVYV